MGIRVGAAGVGKRLGVCELGRCTSPPSRVAFNTSTCPLPTLYPTLLAPLSQGAAEASSASARAWRLNKGKSAAPKPAPEPGPSKAEARPQAGPGGLWLPSQLRRPPCAFLAGATVKTAALAPTEKLPPRALPTAAVWGAVAQAVPVLPVGADVVLPVGADVVHRPMVGGLAAHPPGGSLLKARNAESKESPHQYVVAQSRLVGGDSFSSKTVPGARISTETRAPQTANPHTGPARARPTSAQGYRRKKVSGKVPWASGRTGGSSQPKNR